MLFFKSGFTRELKKEAARQSEVVLVHLQELLAVGGT
jgi:hypothetical protein